MLTRPIEQKVLDGIAFESVADLGCGDGSRLIRMCRDGSRRGLGVEADERACEAATKSVAEAGLSDRVTIVRDDARRWDGRRFPGVDLVTCFLMLHDLFAAVEEPADAVRKLIEVFPDARRFLIADTAAVNWAGHEGPLPAFSLGFELLHAYMETPIVGADTYLNAFAGAGLRVERREQFGSPSTWLYLLVRE
ncbi:methyltransferase domain-containing protein [Nonomuraea antimicrobica]